MSREGALCEKVARENVASQLLSLGKEIVDMASGIRNKQEDKLECVTRPSEDKKLSSGVDQSTEPWPPLLAEIRESFWQIRRNLNGMNDTLDRLEI